MSDIYASFAVEPNPQFLEVGHPTLDRVKQYENEIIAIKEQIIMMKAQIDEDIFWMMVPLLLLLPILSWFFLLLLLLLPPLWPRLAECV